jgi:hypothetical protein
MMETIIQALAQVGVGIPRVLLPGRGVDCHKFAVIACDQFSAQPSYWQRVEDLVEDKPSALRLMIPEAWLGESDAPTHEAVVKTMREYLSSRVLADIGETFVFLRRRTTGGLRRGLLVMLDLDAYDYTPGAKTLIRATEDTVVQRLPPRVAVRRDAPLEMPHIMVLVNDRADRLMSLLESRADDMECLYDFGLMLNGGHLSGYRADSPVLLGQLAQILSELKAESEDGFLFAMGDGNHSFAAAKACWEEIKPGLSPDEQKAHPARWCMAELVNLYDPALKFEPIHRLLYHVDPAGVQADLGFDAENPPSLQILQPMLDEWLKSHPEAELEYIHGAAQCRELAAAESNRLAIVFGPFEKDSLFETVRRNGAFVRKSFSMGEARYKRY